MVLMSIAVVSSASAQTGTSGARSDSAAASPAVSSPPPPAATSVTPTPPDFPRIKVSGLMFGDLYANPTGNPNHVYVGSTDLGKVNIDGNGPITQDLNGYQIRRVYLQVDDDLSIKVACRVRLEVDGKELTSGSKETSFIKNAYALVRQVYPRADLSIGITNTPTFENSENFWGYRSVEKTIADFRGVASSSDAGFSVKGFVDGNHHVGYYGMLGNGTFQKPETNRDKRFYFALPLLMRDLRVEPYVDYESVPGKKDVATYKVFVGYEFKRVAVGYEQLERVVHDPVAPYQKPRGYSAFARAAIRPNQLNVYGRVDRWQPDVNNPNRVDSDLYIAGIDWQPVKDLHFEPNLEATQYHGKGTAVPPPYHDVQARLTVYILFR